MRSQTAKTSNEFRFGRLTKSLALAVTHRSALRELGFGLAGVALATFAVAMVSRAAADTVPTNTPTKIPWSELGTKAGADYKGDGIAVVSTAEGARLRCVFQRLEGEATREGLWLTSTVTNSKQDHFHVLATALGRQSSSSSFSSSSSSSTLQKAGTVCLEGQKVRFVRPILTEEYTVTMDGVRQDFLLSDRPGGVGELVLNLAVSGAKIEPAPGGARLALENSGRKIAYARLRATDASGKELLTHMEVSSPTTLAVVIDDMEALYPIRIDPTFSDANWISMGAIPGAENSVYAAVVDGAGNLYIGGLFTVVGDVVANRVAKWDGYSWSALGAGLNGPAAVYALAVSGTNLYAAGYFTNADGIAATNIARWNGSSWSALGLGIGDPNVSESVYALAVSGTDVYAGGDFTTAGGSPASYIAKWDGGSWSALGSGMDGTAWALAISGSDLYAGGDFTTAGGSTANYVAKWDGSNWSPLDLGMDGTVWALTASGGDVYAGGEFYTAGSITANRIAKWDGSSWSALGSGMDGTVWALAVSGSDLYAGGDFTHAGGIDANLIAEWNGSSWSALGSGMDGRVWALAVSGSGLFAEGDFITAGGVPAFKIAKWNGGNWSALGSGSGVNAPVFAVAVSGGNLYAGGGFTAAGDSPASYVAKWNGSTWSALGSGMESTDPDPPVVYALALSGNNLFAAGHFTRAGGVAATNIARWDGSSWSALGQGLIPYAYVRALAVSGSNLYAGGDWVSGPGISPTPIAKWDGSSWSTLGSGVDNAVYSLAVSGSDLYAGGDFTHAGGSNANYVAKWNGSAWKALGSGVDATGFSPSVRALAVSGTNLYAGGSFTTAGGIPATNIARWDGSSWSALGSGMNWDGDALAVWGSDLYVGGSFSMAGAVAANGIAKWDGRSWSALGSGMNGNVRALAVSGSDLFGGGDFTTAGGKVSAYLARAIVNPPTLAIDPDGFGGYFINFSGVPGSAYRLQRAQNLTGPWTTSSPQTAPGSGLVQFWDLFPPPGQGFYRTVQP